MLAKAIHWFRVVRSRRHEKKKDKTRSPRWPGVRDHCIAERKKCEACHSTENMQVHHIIPFHLHPELELEQSNLLVLCMGPFDCHLLLGHGGSFSTYNPDVRKSVARFTAGSRTTLWKEAKLGRRKD